MGKKNTKNIPSKRGLKFIRPPNRKYPNKSLTTIIFSKLCKKPESESVPESKDNR